MKIFIKLSSISNGVLQTVVHTVGGRDGPDSAATVGYTPRRMFLTVYRQLYTLLAEEMVPTVPQPWDIRTVFHGGYFDRNTEYEDLPGGRGG